MNKALRRMSIACLAMFVVLLGWVNYLQVFKVNSLASEPGNLRVFDQQQVGDAYTQEDRFIVRLDRICHQQDLAELGPVAGEKRWQTELDHPDPLRKRLERGQLCGGGLAAIVAFRVL